LVCKASGDGIGANEVTLMFSISGEIMILYVYLLQGRDSVA
jgi:hypothetical protein